MAFRYLFICYTILSLGVFQVPTNTTFIERKFGSETNFVLYNFDFSKSNQLATTTIGYPSSGSFGSTTDIFKYRADLEYITECNQDCYELYDTKLYDGEGNIEMTFDDYLLVYKD